MQTDSRETNLKNTFKQSHQTLAEGEQTPVNKKLMSHKSVLLGFSRHAWTVYCNYSLELHAHPQTEMLRLRLGI